jgi:hypothetical protein
MRDCCGWLKALGRPGAEERMVLFTAWLPNMGPARIRFPVGIFTNANARQIGGDAIGYAVDQMVLAHRGCGARSWAAWRWRSVFLVEATQNRRLPFSLQKSGSPIRVTCNRDLPLCGETLRQ